MTKLCTKCGVEKDVCEFGRRRLSPDGRQTWCRDCRREYQRAYAQKFRNPEKHREAQRRYRLRQRAIDWIAAFHLSLGFAQRARQRQRLFAFVFG